jgi:hypothetical protein
MDQGAIEVGTDDASAGAMVGAMDGESDGSI